MPSALSLNALAVWPPCPHWHKSAFFVTVMRPPNQRLGELFKIAVISESDKNMGPVIVCRRWLDSRIIETILKPGFAIIGCYDEDLARGGNHTYPHHTK
eukprot:SAG11_NODE_2962_length_2807_cov_9.931315_1_plen_99_part_00